MSKNTILGMLEDSTSNSEEFNGDVLQLGDLFGSAYFTRPAGRVERITISALANLLSQRTKTPVATINADIRRLLNIRKLDEMTMGGFEEARAHLAARIPD